jgi:hypothetical protein
MCPPKSFAKNFKNRKLEFKRYQEIIEGKLSFTGGK